MKKQTGKIARGENAKQVTLFFSAKRIDFIYLFILPIRKTIFLSKIYYFPEEINPLMAFSTAGY